MMQSCINGLALKDLSNTIIALLSYQLAQKNNQKHWIKHIPSDCVERYANLSLDECIQFTSVIGAHNVVEKQNARWWYRNLNVLESSSFNKSLEAEPCDPERMLRLVSIYIEILSYRYDSKNYSLCKPKDDCSLRDIFSSLAHHEALFMASTLSVTHAFLPQGWPRERWMSKIEEVRAELGAHNHKQALDSINHTLRLMCQR